MGPWEDHAGVPQRRLQCLIFPWGRLGCLIFPWGQPNVLNLPMGSTGVPGLPMGSAIGDVSINLVNMSTLTLNALAKTGFGIQAEISYTRRLQAAWLLKFLRSRRYTQR